MVIRRDTIDTAKFDKVTNNITPKDLVLGLRESLTDEDWDQYFKLNPVTNKSKTAQQILNNYKK